MALFQDVPGQAWIVAEWLGGRSQTSIGRELGVSVAPVCTAINRFCFKYARRHAAIPPNAGRQRIATLGLVAFVDAGGKALKPERYTPREDGWVRYERVGLMRAEGMTYDEIGAVMAISKERVRQMLCRFGRRMNRAMTHTKWRVVLDDGQERPVLSDTLEIERAASAAFEDLGQGVWSGALESQRRMWRDLAKAMVSDDPKTVAKAQSTLNEIDDRIAALIRDARETYRHYAYRPYLDLGSDARLVQIDDWRTLSFPPQPELGQVFPDPPRVGMPQWEWTGHVWKFRQDRAMSNG